MKKILFCALASAVLFVHPPAATAAPKTTRERQARIHEMCRHKEQRHLMIMELMSTTQGKKELADMLRHDAEFRSFYETQNVNPG